MENQAVRADHKLSMFIRHSLSGVAEIDRNGNIIHLNPRAEDLLKPVRIAHSIQEDNLYPVLDTIAPVVSRKIKSSPDDAGNIITNEVQSFSLPFGGDKVERHFSFSVIKLYEDCIIVSFDDFTHKRQKEDAIQKLLGENAIIEGKLEIASNILHDIGNALVGFGSYIGRIKRSLDQNSADNLSRLSEFFGQQEIALASVFGVTKAEAAVKMLTGLAETQKNSYEEIRKSITEQLNLITHVQEILTIQRQYSYGNDNPERCPVNLRSIILDCRSMLLASLEKRGIICVINAPDKLPVIKGDRTRLMQVVMNIIKNSVEAIDLTATEKKITIEAKSDEEYVTIRIRDNGHGFDSDTGAKLFERGFTTKAHGSGIGLSSCRSIVEAHDGTMDITSEGFGKGALTTIKFKI